MKRQFHNVFLQITALVDSLDVLESGADVGELSLALAHTRPRRAAEGLEGGMMLAQSMALQAEVTPTAFVAHRTTQLVIFRQLD